MDQMTRSIKGVPWGGFSAIFATALLFTVLPLLTSIQPQSPVTDDHRPFFVDIHKPPPPPSETREQSEAQELNKKNSPKMMDTPHRKKLKYFVLKPGPSTSIGPNLIDIPVVSNTRIEATKRSFAYNPNDVDNPPRYLRKYPPKYPFIASRDHIEGKVSLRFVVDIDGLAKEVEVVKAEPEGYFEEAALEALERYKFKPAIKNGEAVMCNAALTLTFVLD